MRLQAPSFVGRTVARVVTTALAVVVALAFARPAPAQDAPAPAPIVSADPALEAALAPIVQDRSLRGTDVGVHLVRVSDGATVFAQAADTLMLPASTMKVVTAAAALDALGPSYRFTTELLHEEDIDAAGVLHGNLYVKGGGDPTLVLQDLWKIVYDLKTHGVTRIEGDVVFDESLFGTDHRLVGWDKASDIENGPSYFTPLSALSLNYNTIALVTGPGVEAGKPVRAELETPVGDLYEIDNQAVTGAAGTRRNVQVEREIDGQKMKFVLTGSIPIDGEVDLDYRAVPDPTAYFIAAFRQLARERGVTVAGRWRLGNAPRDAELLLRHRSAPLAVVLMDMNKYSNNHYAEQVLRVLGAEVHGVPGTTESGIQVVDAYLSGLGLDASTRVLVNGSGLSRGLMLTPATLTRVLVDMAGDWSVGHEFAASLAIAGRDGTLWRRVREDPGRLRGKTGTLDGVHGLCGYVTGTHGDLYAFAFLVNDVSGTSSPIKRVHDRFVREVMGSGVEEAAVASGDDE